MKKLKEMNNHFINELDRYELLINKNKKFCTTLNYIKHFRTLIFAVIVLIFISAFSSIIDISKGIMIFTKGLNICPIIAWIKNYKSVIKK